MCNNFGNITIFNISANLSQDAGEESRVPVFTFQAHDGPAYTLVTTEKLLISGGTGDIKAWNWADILHKTPKVVWSLSIPTASGVNVFSNPEVNILVLDQKDDATRLFAGCGDNNVYIWDLSSGSLETSFQGHTDYIHDLALRNNACQCVTASEDGTARIWDVRTPYEPVHVLEPFKQQICSRPQYGKWLGCVAVDPVDDWVVCGGGPHLSLWHMRSLTPTTIFPAVDACQNTVLFYEDTLISAGNQSCVNHWFINGEQKAKVPCTPSCVLNVKINTQSDSNRVLSIAGTSYKVDVCTNFGYKAFSLRVG